MELVVFALVVAAAILIFRVFKLDRFWEDDEDVDPVKCYKCGADRQRKTRSEINETELIKEPRDRILFKPCPECGYSGRKLVGTTHHLSSPDSGVWGGGDWGGGDGGGGE